MTLLLGGRPSRVIENSGLFAIGAVAAGAGFYAALAGLGGLLPIASRSLGTAALAMGGTWSLLWYAYPKIPMPSPRKQLNRSRVRIPLIGPTAFGAVLGMGLFTAVATPLVWAGAIAIFAAGSIHGGVFYGIAFGFGRTAQFVARRLYRPSVGGEIVRRIGRRARRYHTAGAALALALIAFGVANHL